MKPLSLILTAILTIVIANPSYSESPFGSGYEDMRGTVINYEYDGFDGFHLAIYNGSIKWLGQKGYFEGISSEVKPIISKVAGGVYFFSWPIGPNGGDNVVHNYNSMTVNAHLQSARGASAMEMIHGKIYCVNTPECKFPHAELTPGDKVLPSIIANARAKGLAPMFNPATNNKARFEEDVLAREELADKAIKYETPEGPVRIEIDGEETRVSENGAKAKAFQTYATKLADSLYFISWMGPRGGNHIIVNAQTGKVFDHIMPDGSRKEAIYDLTCLASAKACS